MTIDWLSFAKRTLTFNGSGSHLEGQWKIVLHTTEGSTLAGALGAYRNTLAYPHLTVGPDAIEQHCSFLGGATALQNLPGGVQTNRSRALQIEIVGFAAGGLFALAPNTKLNLIKTINALVSNFEIDETAIPEFQNYPDAYGPAGGTNRVRFTDELWRNFNGICGHQHVPENLHGDPGALDVRSLMGWYVPSHHQEEKLDLASKRVVEIDGGVEKIAVLPDGSTQHFTHTNSFFGNMTNLPPEDKKDVTEILAITLNRPNSYADGYTLWSQKGLPYVFDAKERDKLHAAGRI